MKNVEKYIDIGIRHFVYSMLGITLIVFMFTFIKGDTAGEANTGDFSSVAFNDNWSLMINDSVVGDVNLPTKVDCKPGDQIIISNQLPKGLTDNMQLCMRTDLQDVQIYVDGELREAYTTDGFAQMTYYLPSEYVFVQINAADEGKTVKMCLTVKKKGIINRVALGNGNNAWFNIISENIGLTLIALFVMLFSFVAIIIYLFLKDILSINKSIFYLSLLMSAIGIWMLGESKIRQLFMARPSLSSYIVYFAVELVGPLSLLYFDNVQHKKYRKIYRVLEVVASAQLAINIILSLLGVAALTETLVFSHVEILVGIIFVLINVIRDFKSREILTYEIVAVGIALFVLFGFVEIINFYSSNLLGYGTFLGVGLLFLLFTTVMQIVSDTIGQVKTREKQQQESWINTIETIASTIDAKDEYTGGHSNRVSEYAGILARGMAADYDFSEEDIVWIRYIGLMHDIGKIGVADTILNKTGRLTDEEFTLMKKHVEIGDSLLKSMDGSMEGLLDGVRHHHERFDGKGYPNGLEGTDIPLIARILCIADCYDAMTSNRVYRRRLSDEAVREELLRCAGTQFDPALISIFVDLLDRGDITPATVNGMEVDANGTVRKSSVLEHRLQTDIALNEETIKNPSHIRMACYIMKLAEYRNQQFEGFIIEPKNATPKETMDTLLKKYIQSRDINIEYTEVKNLVAFFGRTSQEIEEICGALADSLVLSKL